MHDRAAAGIVAREPELAALDAFLAGARRALLIAGPPGIGKTTLWETGIDRARARGDRVLAARPSDAEARLSFTALIDLFDGVGADTLDGLPAPQARALEVALLRREPAADAPEPGAIALGVLNGLRALAAAGPVLVAIDDLQWLDPPSAEALGFAARRLDGAPVRFLLARRPRRVGPLERALGRGALARLDVGPLDLDATRGLLAGRLGVSVSRPLLRRVADATLGNPLFALELGRTLAAGGPPAIGGELIVPEAVEDILGTRVAALPEGQRRILLAVALSGDIKVGELMAAAGADRVEAAIDAGLLRVDGEHVRASHPLLGAAARQRAGASERRALHQALAGAVADPELRAQHLALATRRPDAALAATVAAAAVAAAARGARQEAVAARRARPAADAGRRRRAARAAARARRLPRARGRAAARHGPAHAGARGPARRAAARAGLDRAVRGRRRAHPGRHRAPPGCRARRGRRRPRGPRLRPGQARLAHGRLRRRRPRRGRGDGARGARAGGRRPRTSGWRSTRWRGSSRSGAGRSTSCARGSAPCRTPPRSSPSHPSAPPSNGSSGAASWNRRAPALTTSLRRADEQGEPVSYALQRLHLCELELRTGDWDAAGALLDEWAESAEAELLVQPMYQRCRALEAAGRGRPAEAEAWAARAIAAAAEVGVGWDRLEALRARGLALLLAREPAAAADALRAVWTHCVEHGIDEPGVFPVAPDLVEALVELEALDEARAVIERLERLATEQDHPWARASARRAAAAVALAAGEEAAGALADAADELGALGLDFDRARTLLALGRALRRRRAWRAAREALERAAEAFDALGSDGWAEQARAELDRIAARRGRPAGELTPAEEQVARLAIEGRSNKEIAAALVVTVHTVEAHLSNCYAKLGIRSRTQLAGAKDWGFPE